MLKVYVTFYWTPGTKGLTFIKLFHDRGPYHIETSLLISLFNQWTVFYMIVTSVIKELSEKH